MSRGIKAACLLVGCGVFLSSCASLGTRVEVLKSESISSIQVVGLAPILVDDHTLFVCGQAESVAQAALINQIEQSGAFRIVGIDTLLAHVDQEAAVSAEALLAAADQLGLDGVLFCKLSAYEAEVTTSETVGWGVSFGTAGTHVGLVREAVTNVNWLGAKVSLQIAESSTRELVSATEFDTVKGKSYWTAPPPEDQIADAVEGAFRPIAEAWVK